MHDFVQTKTAELGIPDWRDPTAYPNPDDLSIFDWRWEFLRRNPDYREAYNRPETAFEDESKSRFFERAYLLRTPVDPRLPVKKYIETISGIFHSGYFDNFVGSGNLSSKYAHKSEINRILCHSSDHDIFFRCDPLKPLEVQFEAFLKIASASQRSLKKKLLRPRMRKDRWPLYLRVLDALDCQATYSEIAQVCLPHQEQFGAARAAYDLAKQARKLRDDWPFASEVQL
jgi:hypothetical protein